MSTLLQALDSRPRALTDIKHLTSILFAYAAFDGLEKLSLIYKNSDGKYESFPLEDEVSKLKENAQNRKKSPEILAIEAEVIRRFNA